MSFDEVCKFGYLKDFSLSQKDLVLARELILDQFYKVLLLHNLKHSENSTKVNISEYHKISHLIDHRKAWLKKNRIFTENSLSKFLNISFFDDLRNKFGNFDITNEEFSKHPEVYWRLVRPNTNEDVGPIHADYWFWEMGDENLNTKYKKRLKVWLSIYSDFDSSGFQYVPDSHKQNWKYIKFKRFNKFKPKLDFNIKKLNIIKLKAREGDAFIFHDRLLHGGYTTNNTTRVSLEFTMAFK